MPESQMGLTLPDLVAKSAHRFGDRAAIRDGGTSISFTRLAEYCARTGAGFKSLGVTRGDLVALWAPNRWEWIVAAVGIQAAGGAIVPLSTRARGAEVTDILARSGAQILVLVDEFLGTQYSSLLEPYYADIPTLRTLVVLGDAFEHPSLDVVRWESLIGVPTGSVGTSWSIAEPDDLADVMFTSGTTGRPKGVMLSHRQTIDTYTACGATLGIIPGDKFLIVNPFFHSFGYKAGWVVCLLYGATIYPMAQFDPRAALQLVSREGITVFPGTPTLYYSLLQIPSHERADLSSLRVAMTGGAPIPGSLVRRMLDELNFASVHTAYGLTESSALVTMSHADDPMDVITSTVGSAIPGVQVQIRDEMGNVLPPEQDGEIVVRGPNVMSGYFRDPGGTAASIDSDGWLRTGDLGRVRADGNLVVTDRLKDMFICGGFNCYPAEIENLLLAHPMIDQVAVVGVSDQRMGEVAAAFVMPAGDAELDTGDLTEWARSAMSNYKVPRHWIMVSELPTTASGKVKRAELRRRLSG